MKITKRELKQMINESVREVLNESGSKQSHLYFIYDLLTSVVFKYNLLSSRDSIEFDYKEMCITIYLRNELNKSKKLDTILTILEKEKLIETLECSGDSYSGMDGYIYVYFEDENFEKLKKRLNDYLR